MSVRTRIQVLLALMFVYSGAAAQNEQPRALRAAVRTVDGAHFIWNQPGNNFTLEIKGKDVRPNNSSQDVYFKVDGDVLQIQCAAISQFVDGSQSPVRDSRTILTAHKDWESQYAGSVLGERLKVRSVGQKSADGRESLYWKFDTPKNFTGPGKTRLFLTTINGEYVIALSCVIMSSDEEPRVRRLLFDTLATLRVSAKPFDFPQP